MNIIYYCFAGAHASVVASALHCGLMPVNNIPTYDEFMALPYFDRTAPELIGTPYFMGRDEFGNDVYFMGMWNQRDNIAKTITSVLALVGIGEEQYLLQDAFPLINFSTKFGGLLSKRYSLTVLGRKMVIWGIQRRYYEFVALVSGVKARLESTKIR